MAFGGFGGFPGGVGFNPCCCPRPHVGTGLAIILVLFILLVIIGRSFVI